MHKPERPTDLAVDLQAIADEHCKKNLVGIAIGAVVNGQESQVFSGWADADQNEPVSETTVFEVGSLSKLFTSLLLAVASRKGELQLDDPVQNALGDAVTLPTDGVSHITYRALANHRSSLPRLPADLLSGANMRNPYVHYDQTMLYACLNGMQSLKPIGSRQEYSNFGVGLLGHALGKAAGTDYHNALHERVLDPLGMNDTSTSPRAAQSGGLATAHIKKGKQTLHWDFTEVTVAAGGVRSTLPDMLRFLRANIEPESTPVAEGLKLMREPSELPPSPRGSRSAFSPGYILLVCILFPTIFALVLAIPDWLAYLFEINATSVFRGAFFPSATILAVTMAASIRWGHGGGFYALLGSMLLVWQFVTLDLDWITLAFFGMCHIYVGSTLDELQIDGGGRLAWLTSTVDDHPLLWHNGMVGGSASFLGLIEELEIGVVVMTNTAKSVDSIGLKILSDLVARSDSRNLQPPQPSPPSEPNA